MLPLCFKNSPYVEFKFNGKPVSELLSPEDFAWEAFAAACCANLIGGLFEVCGIGLAQVIRRNVPRAALFALICGVGFVWLGLSPLIDVMREPAAHRPPPARALLHGLLRQRRQGHLPRARARRARHLRRRHRPLVER